MVSAILLAAGRSSRFPGNKLLQPLRGRPLILYALESLLACRLDRVVVVVGSDADAVSALISSYPCDVVLNPLFEAGMSTSIQAGLGVIPAGSDGVMICLGDMPLLRPAEIVRLTKAFEAAPARIVAPVAAGRQANPVILPRRLWPEIESLRGDVGCKEILGRHRQEITYVSLAVLGVLQDADTPEAMESLRRRLEQPISALRVLIRGAGEMATAVAHRLTRSGFKVLLTELPHPMAIRRRVAFSEAVFLGHCDVEGVTARLVHGFEDAVACWNISEVPVLVDPEFAVLEAMHPDVLIDGAMAKKNLGTELGDAPLVIGLGPGFEATRDVHVVIETNRGHQLGRILESGMAEADTGQPGDILGYNRQRVLKAPLNGVFRCHSDIGTRVGPGDLVGHVEDEPICSQIAGIVRGVLRTPTPVTRGTKLADVDPRGNPAFCDTLSDKARTISGGVLEAILTYYNL